MRADLQYLGALSGWYEAAQSHSTWRALYHEREPLPPVVHAVFCDVCHRQFARQSDMMRHKC